VLSLALELRLVLELVRDLINIGHDFALHDDDGLGSFGDRGEGRSGGWRARGSDSRLLRDLR
jgi:hypothetical protein